MKKLILCLFSFGCLFSGYSQGQQLRFKKGLIVDSLRVSDSISETFALYLPTNFENTGKWPVVFVFDPLGRGKQALRMFKEAAEKQHYILAASNNLFDSLSISQNILIANRMFNKVISIFPVHSDRVYTAGFSSGARIASLIPSFIKNIEGVISCGATVPNTDLLNSKNPFHFIGIIGNEDFGYINMLDAEKILNKLKFPNNLIVFDGGHTWPDQFYIEKAMETFTLAAMAKGHTPKDEQYIQAAYQRNLDLVNRLYTKNDLTGTDDQLEQMIAIFRTHMDVESLVQRKKELGKNKLFRAQRRQENSILFNESFIREDYQFSLSEDIESLNFNNLGWWNYQMGELKKYENKNTAPERQVGRRLLGYINALVEDNLDIEMAENQINVDAVHFLWMLKTITDPSDYRYFLKIISDSARYEDYGTALFYLEELLKNGYTNKEELYTLEHTALLRITPEFNKIVDKYLADARYDVIEE